MRSVAAGALVCGLMAPALRAQGMPAHPTIDRLRAAHQLGCGVVQEDAEYSSEDDHSSRGGFDEALCQAIALALGTDISVKLTSFLDESSALDALRTGDIDVIPSISADASHPAKAISLSRPVFYDSLALLVPVGGGARRPQDLAGRKICVLAETGSEEALRTWFAQHHVDYLPFPFQEEGEMEAAYISSNCAALAGERTRLSLIRLSLGASAPQHMMLSEPLSQDAMNSATRANDPSWPRVVDVVLGTLLRAEQLGVTSVNIGSPLQDRPADTVAFMGRTRELGASLGLRVTWAADVLQRVGNYREMYERTLGGGSDRLLPRDLNRLTRDGGLLVPLPLQ